MSNNTSSFSERDVSIRYAQTAPDQELYGGHPSTPPILVDASIESVETVLSDGTEKCNKEYNTLRNYAGSFALRQGVLRKP